jgi:PAS domain S-box-containing protein
VAWGDRKLVKNSTAEMTGTIERHRNVATRLAPSQRSASGDDRVAEHPGGRDAKQRIKPESERCDQRWHFRDLLDALPVAIYTTDDAGRITFFNQTAAEIAGRRPEIGSDEWCVTWRLYWPDGRPMAHDECPMARALKEDRPIRGGEAIAERPDGTRVPFMAYPTPLHDASGQLVGAVQHAS